MTIPIIHVVSIHAENKPWRHLVFWQEGVRCFRLEECGTHMEATEYAAHLYESLGMQGLYRGFPSR